MHGFNLVARRRAPDPRHVDRAGRRRRRVARDERRRRADVGDPLHEGRAERWRPAGCSPTSTSRRRGAVLGRHARAASCSCRRAASCGAWRMPPRPMCPRCRSIEVRWEPTSGRGRVWSFIVPHPPLLPAFAELAPYNAIIVELEEDPTIRFVGNLVAERRRRRSTRSIPRRSRSASRCASCSTRSTTCACRDGFAPKSLFAR